ncbi:MAG: 50S ribosomal protein L29 [Pseudomonadota bacterium]|nr:50S ribosomal protein L29 [Pseudomonadota bacterium]
MKANDMRALDSKALQSKLDELLEQKFTLRMQIATGQQGNHAALRDAKRSIARVKTIMNEQVRGKA